MTSSTLIAPPLATSTEQRRDEQISRTVREARRTRRRGLWRRPRGSLAGSPPGAGGRLLRL